MHKKLLIKNTVSSILFQITAVICGFVLPRLILEHFGSEVNGLVSSITQFLQIIAFLELGIGAVVQSSLYKPLANKDTVKVSEIVASANKFFKRLAIILSIYIAILIFIFPYISDNNFSWIYTTTLIIAISISSFAQYYFGVADRLLLTADQHGYIQFNAQTVTLILNTVACVVLINMDASIQIVKLATSIIFLGRPLFLRLYVNKYYEIDRSITYVGEPIKQKWNGIAQHIAAIFLNSSGVIILTLLSTLENVSIFSTYILVTNGLLQLVSVVVSSNSAMIGHLWAKRDSKLLDIFRLFEWGLHNINLFVFGCSVILILPFISVYVTGVTDADYIQPCFAFVIVMAYFVRCLRIPYNVMILAAGHYKETQNCYIIAVIINLLFSCLLTYYKGLIGVAIGLLIALIYQMIWMIRYNIKNLLMLSYSGILKLILVDVLAMGFSVIFVAFSDLYVSGYGEWIVLATKVMLGEAAMLLFLNVIFYKKQVLSLRKRIVHHFGG